MKTFASKNSSVYNPHASKMFFDKKENQSFFSAANSSEKPFFNSAPVQAKFNTPQQQSNISKSNSEIIQREESTPPNYNESVLIWLNAFIPMHVPDGTKTIKKGAFKGKTCIPAPGPFGCALTDNRTFSKSKNAKTRMRLYILVNLKDLSYKYGGLSDYTYHVNDDTGNASCKKKASGTYIVNGKIMNKDKDALGMKFMAFGNNPCVPMSPDIDFLGMIGIDRKNRRIQVAALLDEFPAFEMYIASTKTFKTKAIFRKSPACNNSRNVMCLFGGATVPAKGDISF